jgi:hypothetical protein
MALLEKKLTHELMTQERLLRHWFGGPQVPFWNYDPRMLTIGVELEYLIARGRQESFIGTEELILATQKDYHVAMCHLIADAGYQPLEIADQPGRIGKDTKTGFIAIKPDFAWHILEVSLPPRRNLIEIQELIESVLREIDRALEKAFLRRLTISSLPRPPKSMELVDMARMQGFTSSVRQKNGDNPFLDPMFPAYITATHVHLNAFDREALSIWPHLYSIEASIGEIYCRAKSFAGQKVESVRSEFLRHTMGDSYKLKGIPEHIPNSVDDYLDALNTSDPAFPNDKFFPVRDVSYIRPSRFGTIEFRSACSSPEVSELVEICAWRITQLVAASRMAHAKADLLDTVIRTTEHLTKIEVLPESAAASMLAKVRYRLGRHG